MSRFLSTGSARQAERLHQAFQDHPTISRRQLAIQMLGLRKPSKERIESKKSQLVTWLRATHGPSDANAELLARSFNALIGKDVYDQDWFKNPDAARTRADLIQENAELRAEIQRLQEAS